MWVMLIEKKKSMFKSVPAWVFTDSPKSEKAIIQEGWPQEFVTCSFPFAGKIDVQVEFT